MTAGQKRLTGFAKHGIRRQREREYRNKESSQTMLEAKTDEARLTERMK